MVVLGNVKLRHVNNQLLNQAKQGFSNLEMGSYFQVPSKGESYNQRQKKLRAQVKATVCFTLAPSMLFYGVRHEQGLMVSCVHDTPAGITQ